MAAEKIRYICPICDQEMKVSRHFCWKCKSRVDEPWRYTGGHLPNEGHEDGCHPMQSHLSPRTPQTQSRTNHGGRSLAGKNNAGKQYTYNRPGQTGTSAGRTTSSAQSGRTTGRTGGNFGTSGRKNSGCGSLIFVVVIFWFLIQFLVGFLTRI